MNNAKTYKCLYCSERFTREEMISHIEKDHKRMIPKHYSAARLVFNYVNKKDHGTCIFCKGVTKWNESTSKYDRLCSDKCIKGYTEYMRSNMIKVYNKPNLLGDDEHQTKMLANRKISGMYKFKDNGSHSYTGSYEKKLLEFMDKVLNISSKDIQSPGPVFEYTYEGETHKWITDIYYIPYNIVIEVKDGGDNPNNRQMPSYRDKQVSKEKMITDLGTFNYLRLTNNNFVQLLEIFAALKMQMIDDSTENAVIRIHEYTALAGISPVVGIGPSKGFVVSYGTRCLKDSKPEGFALANDILSDNILVPEDGKFVKKNTNEFLEDREFNIYEFTGDKAKLEQLILEYKNISASTNTIYEFLSGINMISDDQISYDENFIEVDFNFMKENRDTLSEGVITDAIRSKFMDIKDNVSKRSKKQSKKDSSPNAREIVGAMEKVRDELVWKIISDM